MSKNIKTLVNGITCTNCALTISKYLENNGGSHVHVNPMTGDVAFVVNTDFDEKILFAGINKMGYKVVESTELESGNQNYKSALSWQIIIATLCTMPLLAHMFLDFSILHNPLFQLVVSSIVIAIGIKEFFFKAIQSIRNKMPTMEVLIMIGALASYMYSIVGMIFIKESYQDYLFFETAASIITLILWGNFLESISIKSTQSALKNLLNLKPEYALLLMIDSLGKEIPQKIKIKFLKIGDLILIKEGEKIGADCEIEEGNAFVDEKMLTGESSVVQKSKGDKIFAGSLLIQGYIKARVVELEENNAISEIIKHVKNAQNIKPNIQKLADNIAAWFVPLVIALSILTYVITLYSTHSYSESFMRAVAVLVISCPCAMGLATPVAVMIGVGKASKRGIIIKSGAVLEKLKRIEYIIFDKTGTLTSPDLEVNIRYINNTTWNEDQLKSILKTIMSKSNHPISESITKYLHYISESPEVTDIEESKGKGMKAVIENKNVFVGSKKAMIEEGVICEEYFDLYFAIDQALVMGIMLKDKLAEGSIEVIKELRAKNYNIILLSGDNERKVANVANALGIDNYYFEQMPEMKLNVLKKLTQNNKHVLMVGDGINDAPALVAADIGVSFSHASGIAQSSADIVLIQSGIHSLLETLNIGNDTYLNIKQNLFWAFFYNIIAIPIAAMGYLKPTWGAGIMALSDVFLILNSLRLVLKR